MHQPVLLEEVITQLVRQKDGVYVDATFGCGGHSKEILRQLDAGILVGIDKDPEAIARAKKLSDPRLIIRNGSFARIKEWVVALGFAGKVTGIILDLGISAAQLDNAQRGFSFLRNGPLDMRMDCNQELNATRWLKYAPEHEIVRVLKEYGEERYSKRIARAIVTARAVMPIVTTERLVELVKSAQPKWDEHKHPATRVFQAIRMVVNDELRELQVCLEQCLDILARGGRLGVISFHSLEDRMVKQFMQKHIRGQVPEKLPLRDTQVPRRLMRVGKAIRPSAGEINNNPRSRSAVLRVMEKLK